MKPAAVFVSAIFVILCIKWNIMGIMNKIFGKASEEKETKTLPWNALHSVEQLDGIKAKSTEKTQLIFKHSTRCGISRMVLNQFEKDFDLTNERLDIHFLDLLNHRDVSNEIAATFGVVHESPQVLLIKNGVVVAHASHGAINGLPLE